MFLWQACNIVGYALLLSGIITLFLTLWRGPDAKSSRLGMYLTTLIILIWCVLCVLNIGQMKQQEKIDQQKAELYENQLRHEGYQYINGWYKVQDNKLLPAPRMP